MEDILELIQKVQNKYPSLRFSQIVNIAANRGGWTQKDLFYCPNERIFKGLKLILEVI